jgi:hypothetical protein
MVAPVCLASKLIFPDMPNIIGPWIGDPIKQGDYVVATTRIVGFAHGKQFAVSRSRQSPHSEHVHDKGVFAESLS